MAQTSRPCLNPPKPDAERLTMPLLNSIPDTAPVMKAPALRAVEVITSRLTPADQAEVLNFLAHRPIHTVTMVGFINDNGIVSPLNRGTFYGCRNYEGQLEGVALIGHPTLLETTTHRALEALAEIAQKCTNAHMIMGEVEQVDGFWNHYAKAGQSLRQASREWLFELRWPIEALPLVPGLR